MLGQIGRIESQHSNRGLAGGTPEREEIGEAQEGDGKACEREEVKNSTARKREGSKRKEVGGMATGSNVAPKREA